MIFGLKKKFSVIQKEKLDSLVHQQKYVCFIFSETWVRRHFEAPVKAACAPKHKFVEPIIFPTKFHIWQEQQNLTCGILGKN